MPHDQRAARRRRGVDDQERDQAVTGPPIDHPFHIHINPFQITEVFDPNENLTDPNGQLHRRAAQYDDTTASRPRSRAIPNVPNVTRRPAVRSRSRTDPSTWRSAARDARRRHRTVWWDVFAIPSGCAATDQRPDGSRSSSQATSRCAAASSTSPGLYVLHCHILIHEDRGMMFRVNTGNDPSVTVLQHH